MCTRTVVSAASLNGLNDVFGGNSDPSDRNERHARLPNATSCSISLPPNPTAANERGPR
jgi:hypothetical protein